MARKKPSSSAVPEWIVTFADLMSILVCFFVLIISFSIQDVERLQVVSGSMKDAFGVRNDSLKNGVMEIEGAPVRDYIRRVEVIPRPEDAEIAENRHDQRTQQGPEVNTHDLEMSDVDRPREFSAAAASLRQAWQSMPEVAELSSHLLVEETPEGINIEIVDQDGRSMFPDSSAFPYEHTRQLLLRMAPVLRDLPNRIAVTGHTAAQKGGTGAVGEPWELSSDRANAVRSILAQAGVANDRFHSISGKAESEPLFPDDPFLSANRRVSILLMSEAPPMPRNSGF
jgi:chemotaxis protein MotB